MPRLSPTEDFDRTLAAIPGGLQKLKYLAELRHDGDHHRHWGMERIYGIEESEKVMELAHSALLQHVLQTPLRVLVSDAQEWLREDPGSAAKYLGSWQRYLASSV